MSTYYVWGYKMCHTATHRNEENEIAAPVLYQGENKLCEELDCTCVGLSKWVQGSIK